MVRIWCQKVACTVCPGNGWLLVGDALRSCVNTGISVRGMDMALTGAQAAAQTLISACQHREPQNLFALYHHNVERSLLWDVLQRYQHFATPWLVSGVACVNAGYFPRFMGSG